MLSEIVEIAGVMNVTDKMLAGRWTENEFKVTPRMAVPSRGPIEEQLEELKTKLLSPLMEKVSGANAALIKDLTWAANEATALAWYTVCPLLVLPALLDEKVRLALMRWEKQEQLLRG